MERTKNPPKPAASERYTRKEGTSSEGRGTQVEKRSHRNQYTKSTKEGEGQAGSIRNPRPNRKCAHNHRESKAAHPRHLAKQQQKPGEDGYW